MPHAWKAATYMLLVKVFDAATHNKYQAPDKMRLNEVHPKQNAPSSNRVKLVSKSHSASVGGEGFCSCVYKYQVQIRRGLVPRDHRRNKEAKTEEGHISLSSTQWCSILSQTSNQLL